MVDRLGCRWCGAGSHRGCECGACVECALAGDCCDAGARRAFGCDLGCGRLASVNCARCDARVCIDCCDAGVCAACGAEQTSVAHGAFEATGRRAVLTQEDGWVDAAQAVLLAVLIVIEAIALMLFA